MRITSVLMNRASRLSSSCTLFPPLAPPAKLLLSSSSVSATSAPTSRTGISTSLRAYGASPAIAVRDWSQRDNSHIHLRSETLEDEERTSLIPSDAKRLIEKGYKLTVEKNPARIIPDKEYEEAGCEIVPQNLWLNEPQAVPKDTFILGLKYLCPPDSKWAKDLTCAHRHIYFAHCFKKQMGWRDEMQRFHLGGGEILDLEFLTDENGRRVASFGFYAGYAGAALGLAQFYVKQHQLPMLSVKSFPTKKNLLEFVRGLSPREYNAETPAAVVIGALGAAGRGACQFFEDFANFAKDAPKVQVTKNDLPEMRAPDSREKLLQHEVLVNCINLQGPTEPFVSKESLAAHPRHRLQTVVDVSCDPSSPFNPLPFYDRETTLKKPALVQRGLPDVIAVSHLPSLLPLEASQHFSELLVPHLLTLNEEGNRDVWNRAAAVYDRVLAEAKFE